MKIDFNKLENQKLESFQGGLKHFDANIYNDGMNKIIRGKLIPGASIGLHTHDSSSEIIFITKGCAKFITDDVVEFVNEGECHYCKKGSRHTLINETKEDIEFFAVVPQQ